MAKTDVAIDLELLHPLEPLVVGPDTTNTLPDRALSTRNACTVALVLTWICEIACLCLGFAIIRRGDNEAIRINSLIPLYVGNEILPFLLNVLVASLTNSLG
jgi:hypothetical protein